MYEEEGLDIPDPQTTLRAYLALPMAELAPDKKPPGSGSTMKEIAGSLNGRGMIPLEEFTSRLKMRFESHSP